MSDDRSVNFQVEDELRKGLSSDDIVSSGVTPCASPMEARAESMSGMRVLSVSRVMVCIAAPICNTRRMQGNNYFLEACYG